MQTRFKVLIALVSIALSAGPAAAYIGPGIATGALGAVLGVIGGIFLAIFAVLYYPIKRVLRRRRSKAATVDGGKADPQEK